MGRAVGVDPNVASALRGFYGEAGYRVISGASYGDVGVFARYENFDTQFKMPTGYLPLKEFDRDALVFGVTYWPDPDIALKVRLLRRQKQELDDQRAELVQHRPGMVVLMTQIFTRFNALVMLAGALASSTGASLAIAPAAEAAGRRDLRRAVQLHAV